MLQAIRDNPERGQIGQRSAAPQGARTLHGGRSCKVMSAPTSPAGGCVNSCSDFRGASLDCQHLLRFP
ncbi:hypothetical protein HPB50_023327 [Hyalomma asiaticum]|uniref:Uncharacterized protein n=1 Tax=Hyalomma asiaticum TaxID=266040 RepID=A0ACB7TQ31_HYAAI|nr:hypothetical protein HPB50_023327 [Hyalomma asiaticum]